MDKLIISFSESQFEASTKINKDSFEDVFYCVGFNTILRKKTKVLVRHALNPYEFQVDRSVVHVEPDPEFVCKLYSLAKREQADSIIQIHWHKFSQEPNFSSIDDSCAKMLLEDSKQFNPKINIIQIVFGNKSEYFKARILHNGNFSYLKNIEIIGPNGMNILSSGRAKLGTEKIDEIFEKNVLTFGKQGMRKISRAKVIMIGAGGIASGLLYMMSRIGFRHVSSQIKGRINTSNSGNADYA
jgi:hypothetical protein